MGPPDPARRPSQAQRLLWGIRATEWCEYVYDFGDNWVHDVKLIAPRIEKETFKCRLIGGEGVAPPEDCGGPPGYEAVQHLLATGEDRVGGDPEGLRTWLGGWTPDGFDLAAAKAAFDR